MKLAALLLAVVPAVCPADAWAPEPITQMEPLCHDGGAHGVVVTVTKPGAYRLTWPKHYCRLADA